MCKRAYARAVLLQYGLGILFHLSEKEICLVVRLLQTTIVCFGGETGILYSGSKDDLMFQVYYSDHSVCFCDLYSVCISSSHVSSL